VQFLRRPARGAWDDSTAPAASTSSTAPTTGAGERYVNRRLGKVRGRGEKEGLSRREADRLLRRLMEAERVRPAPSIEERRRTVDDAADVLRDRLLIQGARLSYRQNCESMQRVHISPVLGKRWVETVTPEDVERLGRAMLAKGRAPKTVRNVMTFLHAIFTLAVDSEWAPRNPVARAVRPRRRREGDADPDLQFLTLPELDAVIATIPDHVVDRDALGPVLRLVILAAASTGLRQSELLGLRWKDVDVRAQRVRVRYAWVRYEHSGEGKSDLSTRRSVPMTDRLAVELKKWRLRTVFGDAEHLVFAHPELGVPLDRTKVTRRFQAACVEAGVRTIQEYLGHADLKTTQIYAHYAPSAREVETINEAFGAAPTRSRGRRRSRKPGQ
jgi:integrase